MHSAARNDTNIWSCDENVRIDFVQFRFFGCGVRKDTIVGDFDGVCHHFIINDQNPPEWRRWKKLALCLRAVARVQTVNEKTIALTEEYVSQISNTINKNWTNISFMAMVVLAYCFALRTQDYCVTSSSPTLLWSDLTFVDEHKSLTINIPKSKCNQNGPPESITFFCPCKKNTSHVCAYCTLKLYKSLAEQKCPGNKCVFTKENRYGQCKPFCYKRYLDLFKENFSQIFGNKYNSKIHRPHGLRYGRATDLARMGVPEDTIRRITRHSAKSKVLFRYINMTKQQVAELIQEYTELQEDLKNK